MNVYIPLWGAFFIAAGIYIVCLAIVAMKDGIKQYRGKSE